jgi:hypothetical protein
MTQLRFINGLQFPEVSRVQTRISCNENIRTNDCTRFTVGILGHAHVTLSCFEDIFVIAHAEKEALTWNEYSTFLIAAFVDHLALFLRDESA